MKELPSKGGKIHQDLLKAQERRRLVDKAINAEAKRIGVNIFIYPMMEDVEDTKRQNNTINARRTDVGFTRRLKNPHGLFEVEVRFNDDALYLKTPTECATVRDGFEFFQNRWVLFISDGKEFGTPAAFVKPFKIGMIPKMFGKSIEHCFWYSEDGANANRLNCKISGGKLSWIPFGGQRTLLEKHSGLIESLRDVEG